MTCPTCGLPAKPLPDTPWFICEPCYWAGYLSTESDNGTER